MKTSYPNKAMALLLTLVLCLGASCAVVQADDPGDTEDSTATVTFTAPTGQFILEGVSPSGMKEALTVDFAGEIPMYLSDTYRYASSEGAKPDRWLKITDTYPLGAWNVTATLSLFSEVASDENTTPDMDVFAARLSMAGERVKAYRQIDESADDDTAGLSAGSETWGVPALTSKDSHFVLVSGGAATSLTENTASTRMVRGIFFIRFEGAGITLDNVTPQHGKIIDAETAYAATITWTGAVTADN